MVHFCAGITYDLHIAREKSLTIEAKESRQSLKGNEFEKLNEPRNLVLFSLPGLQKHLRLHKIVSNGNDS